MPKINYNKYKFEIMKHKRKEQWINTLLQPKNINYYLINLTIKIIIINR